jgi:hypothetical protein
LFLSEILLSQETYLFFIWDTIVSRHLLVFYLRYYCLKILSGFLSEIILSQDTYWFLIWDNTASRHLLVFYLRYYCLKTLTGFLSEIILSHFWDRPVPISSHVRFSYLALVQDKNITRVLAANAWCTVYVNCPPILHAFNF